VTPASTLLRNARRAARLTQADLAERLATTQSAVARLERPDANPTIDMLDRALAAAGHRLELSTEPAPPAVDEAQIAAHVTLTPAERLATFSAAHRNLRRLVERTKPAGDPMA
jgi:transcriptional regulator with XRE-family HTH domain